MDSTIKYLKTFDQFIIVIRNKLIFDKQMGMEAMLSDNILIRYEVIMKTINDEKSS